MDAEQRDIIERLEVAVMCIGGYGGYKGDPTLLADLLDELQSLRASQAKVVEAIKSYRSCWDAGSHRVDLYRQKIATEILSCVEAALAEHGGQT